MSGTPHTIRVINTKGNESIKQYAPQGGRDYVLGYICQALKRENTVYVTIVPDIDSYSNARIAKEARRAGYDYQKAKHILGL